MTQDQHPTLEAQIELPPLPITPLMAQLFDRSAGAGCSSVLTELLHEYARQAIAHARKSREEPCGWLYDWTHSSATGKPDEHITAFGTNKAHIEANPNNRNIRAVYTAPQPAEPVKCNACRDSGIVGHSDICPCCKDTWQPADSVVRNKRTTAEPVKGPSDEQADFTKWAEIEYRNEPEYTARDYRMGLDAWRQRARYQGAQPAASAQPVGTATNAGPMYVQGTTIAVFDATDVPVGTKLYAAPVAAQPSTPEFAALKTAEAFSADLPVTEAEDEAWGELEKRQ